METYTPDRVGVELDARLPTASMAASDSAAVPVLLEAPVVGAPVPATAAPCPPADGDVSDVPGGPAPALPVATAALPVAPPVAPELAAGVVAEALVLGDGAVAEEALLVSDTGVVAGTVLAAGVVPEALVVPDACVAAEDFVVPDGFERETVLDRLAVVLPADVSAGLVLVFAVLVVAAGAATGAATIGICPSSGEDPGR